MSLIDQVDQLLHYNGPERKTFRTTVSKRVEFFLSPSLSSSKSFYSSVMFQLRNHKFAFFSRTQPCVSNFESRDPPPPTTNHTHTNTNTLSLTHMYTLINICQIKHPLEVNLNFYTNNLVQWFSTRAVRSR